MTDSEIRELSMEMWGGRCSCPDCPLPDEAVGDSHHGLVHNTKFHKSRHPLLTKSLFNRFPMHHSCHMAHPNFMSITDHRADYLEKYLKSLKEGGK